MTAAYLFHSDGLLAMSRYVAHDSLFAFDLDGTLAPIVEHYSAAKVAEPVRATLERLDKLATLAVITGRSRKDALAVLGFEPRLVIGNHGAEWPSEDTTRNWQQVRVCLDWQKHLFDKLGLDQGIEIEFKGESISVHYRKADDTEMALSKIHAAIDPLEPPPQIIGGKFVVNLLPPDASTKGDALVAAMHRFGLERAIYFGDDVTDEEIFRLKNVDVFGIHVGMDGQTAAPFYLKNQAELLGLLNSMVGILETQAGRD